MLTDQLRLDLRHAMVAKDSIKKDILRVALAEIELQETRQKKSLLDDEQFAVLRKIIANNNETLSHGVQEKLVTENQILESYLPKLLSQDQIKEHLTAILTQLKEAKNPGAAIGQAVKYLKSQNLSASGSDVNIVVKELLN